jgi:hypothetical protein
MFQIVNRSIKSILSNKKMGDPELNHYQELAIERIRAMISEYAPIYLLEGCDGVVQAAIWKCFEKDEGDGFLRCVKSLGLVRMVFIRDLSGNCMRAKSSFVIVFFDFLESFEE